MTALLKPHTVPLFKQHWDLSAFKGLVEIERTLFVILWQKLNLLEY